MRVRVCPLCTSSSITKQEAGIKTTVGEVETYKCGNSACESHINGYVMAILFVPRISGDAGGIRYEQQK
jgi:hypothetical protein